MMNQFQVRCAASLKHRIAALWWLLSCTFLLYSGAAHAVLELEITQAIDAAMPIAVAPFSWGGVIPPSLQARQDTANISEVIHNDLARSGEFSVLSSQDNLDLSSIEPQDIDFAAWRAEGIESLVVGSVTPASGDQYQIRFMLLDIARGVRATPSGYGQSILSGQTFTVSGSTLRYLSHHISDLIYETLTGYEGVFTTRIAYVTTQKIDNDMRYRLDIADVDGYNAQPLITSTDPIASPAWSPDGKKLAYVSFENRQAQIFISDVSTGERELISAFPGINGAPAWSPDGQRLAVVLSYERTPKIYIIDLTKDESDPNRLTQVTDGWGVDTEPQFTPDGQSIIFTSDRGGQPQLYEVNLRGNQRVERLTFEGNYNASPSLSRDGRWLTMIHRSSQGPYQSFQIAVLDRISNQLQVLTNTHQDKSPSIAPNGRMLLYATKSQGNHVLGAVSIDGRVRLLLPSTEGDVTDPAWSPYLL